MSKSPTPSERERSDATAREREKAEQALLPYRWTQTIKDVDVTVPVRGTLKGKDIVVNISKTHLKVGVRGEEPIIDVCGGEFLFCFGIYQFWGREKSSTNIDISLAFHRAPSPTPSSWTNPPGRSKPRRRRAAKKSASTWTKATRWNGGPAS